jgi:hypothetical protein
MEYSWFGDAVHHVDARTAGCDDAMAAENGELLGDGGLRGPTSGLECTHALLGVSLQAIQQPKPERMPEALDHAGGGIEGFRCNGTAAGRHLPPAQ